MFLQDLAIFIKTKLKASPIVVPKLYNVPKYAASASENPNGITIEVITTYRLILREHPKENYNTRKKKFLFLIALNVVFKLSIFGILADALGGFGGLSLKKSRHGIDKIVTMTASVQNSP